MMQPWTADGLYLGERLENREHFAFFGSASLTKDHLAKRFPQFKFAFLKQVHGRTVVEAGTAALPEADGQYTNQKNIALVIQTADCVPILMGNRQEIAALHAGWRGVAANIVGEAALRFKSKPAWVSFGPHIQFGSFEVGLDVAEQLVKVAPSGVRAADLMRPHADAKKCFFNLEVLLRAQVRAQFPDASIWCSSANTIADSRYHSFRRDKPDQGRQYSFVVLKE